jgi:hypothetical protein
MCHQVSGCAHVDDGIQTLLNKYNSPMISAQDFFQLRAPH